MRLRALASRRPPRLQPLSVIPAGGAGVGGRLVPFPESRTGALALASSAAAPALARRALRRPVSVSLWSFLLLVLVPTALAGSYYLAIASDQYVAELRFTVRSSETPRLDALALFESGVGHQPGAAESHVVVQYLGSRAAVDDIRGTIDLAAMFGRPAADWWARLPSAASAETLVEYWRHQVDPFYDPANGAVTVRVRAFTPEESLHLAQAVIGAAERLVNDLSSRARRDALHHAEAEVAASETRLKTVLGQIREFREKQGLLDPGRTAEASAGLSARLRDELARANAELAMLKTYMRDDAPSVKVTRARIRSLEGQRRVAIGDLTEPGQGHGEPLSRAVGDYEQLDAERKFAEAAYQHALAALDRARAETDRQQLYLASFVPPSLPEEALYPRRWRSVGVVALIAFALWAIGGLALQSIRDHL